VGTGPQRILDAQQLNRLILKGESLRKAAAKRAGLEVKQDAWTQGAVTGACPPSPECCPQLTGFAIPFKWKASITGDPQTECTRPMFDGALGPQREPIAGSANVSNFGPFREKLFSATL
jgi:hypothetical protein